MSKAAEQAALIISDVLGSSEEFNRSINENADCIEEMFQRHKSGDTNLTLEQVQEERRRRVENA